MILLLYIYRAKNDNIVCDDDKQGRNTLTRQKNCQQDSSEEAIDKEPPGE